jgi:cytochrome c peroxidase
MFHTNTPSRLSTALLYTPLLLFLVAFTYRQYTPPDKNVVKADKIMLGKMLFFDPILSIDNSVSCASCHKPQFAFADSARFSTGVFGKKTRRNTPSILNMSARDAYFYDGRAATLEEQALMPIQHPDEMALSIPDAVARLRNSRLYAPLFKKLYKKAPDAASLADALAAFERTLETANTEFDKYAKGNKKAMSADAIAGRKVFMEKGKCFDCHFGPDFTGDEFKNIGTFNNKNLNDAGRFYITKDSSDRGKFKVPGLRNIALTAPYMHNGMFTTLREVIDFYDNPLAVVPDAKGIDSTLKEPLRLTELEKVQLEAFMRALTDHDFENKLKDFSKSN